MTETTLIILAVLGWVAGTAGCAIAIYAKLSCKAMLTIQEAAIQKSLRAELQDAMNDVHAACQSDLFELAQSIREDGIIPASLAKPPTSPFDETANFRNLV
jgi:hypothetical protein